MLFSSVLGAAILDARKYEDQAPFTDTAGKGSETGWRCSYVVHENRLVLVRLMYSLTCLGADVPVVQREATAHTLPSKGRRVEGCGNFGVQKQSHCAQAPRSAVPSATD